MQTHPLIGIGFGPSNIALAIALKEREATARAMHPVFIEKQPRFAWHRDMPVSYTHLTLPTILLV